MQFLLIRIFVKTKPLNVGTWVLASLLQIIL